MSFLPGRIPLALINVYNHAINIYFTISINTRYITSLYIQVSSFLIISEMKDQVKFCFEIFSEICWITIIISLLRISLRTPPLLTIRFYSIPGLHWYKGKEEYSEQILMEGQIRIYEDRYSLSKGNSVINIYIYILYHCAMETEKFWNECLILLPWNSKC